MLKNGYLKFIRNPEWILSEPERVILWSNGEAEDAKAWNTNCKVILTPVFLAGLTLGVDRTFCDGTCDESQWVKGRFPLQLALVSSWN